MDADFGSYLRDALVEASAVKHPEMLVGTSLPRPLVSMRMWWARKRTRPGDWLCPSCGRRMRVVGDPLPFVREWGCRCGTEFRVARPR